MTKTLLPLPIGVHRSVQKGTVAMKSDDLMQVIMQEPEGSARALAAAEALIVMTLPHGEPDAESFPEYGEVLV